MSLSNFLKVSPIHINTQEHAKDVNEISWTIEKDWHSENEYYKFEAKSTSLINQCINNPKAEVIFPSVTHGTHEFFINNKKIFEFGVSNFETVRSFYGVPTIKCEVINSYVNSTGNQNEFQWIVHSYSKYFSRIGHSPFLSSKVIKANFIAENLNAITGASLLVMSLISFFLFQGKVAPKLTTSLALSNLAMAIYFCCTTPFLFYLPFSMKTMHKCADSGLWIGFVFIFYCIYLEGVISKKVYLSYLCVLFPSLIIILFGSSGDVIQFGTTIPFGFTLSLLFYCAVKFTKMLFKSKRKLGPAGQALGFTIFALSGVHDIFTVTGLMYGQMFLCMGVVGVLFFIMIAVNEQIMATYIERDYLRENLEKEVERKTVQLKEKTVELENSMKELQTTQAELLQSSKLASIGTLAAGIAHEINNSINYVNGSIVPLERLAEKIQDDKSKERFKNLIGVMKQGTQLTIDIIKSLKQTSGVNQAEINDLKLDEIMQSVLNILKSKYKNSVEIVTEVNPSHQVYGSIVGLSQVFMNLIGNAVDAIENRMSSNTTPGKIIISSEEAGESLCIKIQDNGEGMSEETKRRVFEPFFTTKPVGKGTGLGLYIVNNEIKKHHGKVEIDSALGVGTTFKVILPKNKMTYQREVA